MERFFDRLDRMLGTPARWDTAREGVPYWRNRVLDVAMVVAVVLGSLSVIPGVARALAEQKYGLMVADIAVLVIALGVLLHRGLPYRLRAGLLVLAAFSIGIIQIITSGIHSPGPLWLFAGPVVAAILFDLRLALTLVAVTGLTFAAQLVLDQAGLLSGPRAAEVGSPRWVEVATDLMLLSTVISLFMGVLLRGLRTSFEKVRRVSDDLEAERARLLTANRALKQQMDRRRQAEEERARLASAMEQAEDGMAIIELDGRLRYVNRAFERLFAVTASDVVGQRVREIGLFVESERASDAFDALHRDDAWTGRLAARREAARWPAQASISTLRDPEGRPSHRLLVIRDMSREAKLETQLQQAQKMQAIGTFAGGIAHDFNNLLVPILGTADLLRNELEDEWQDRLEDIVRAARRGKDLVAQILAFSRGGERKDTTTPVGPAIEETDRLLRASLPANIELEYAIIDDGAVRVSESEIQQVLMNLCTNAFHAMRREGGRLRISVDRIMGSAVDTRNAMAAAPPVPDQEYVRFTVADSGEGMDMVTLERVFEPFFTTKTKGQGTGLGLAMVHGVARAAGGTLVIRSAPGVGTTASVLLPRCEPQPVAVDQGEQQPEEGAGQRVMVVDDEEPVRVVAGRFLRKLGYETMLHDAEEAHQVLSSDEPLDLLVTDLSMPGMNGLELGKAARRTRPGLPMLLCTGLVDRDTLREARDAGFEDVLAKPFDMQELSDAVARVLATGREPVGS